MFKIAFEKALTNGVNAGLEFLKIAGLKLPLRCSVRLFVTSCGRSAICATLAKAFLSNYTAKKR